MFLFCSLISRILFHVHLGTSIMISCYDIILLILFILLCCLKIKIIKLLSCIFLKNFDIFYDVNFINKSRSWHEQ